MIMRFLLLLGLLLGAAAPSSSQDVMIIPNRAPVVIPSRTNTLMPGIPLICGLNPDTLQANVNYTTRWILPNEQTITSSQGRFVFSESTVTLNNGPLPGTVLVVTGLSYQDAGTYTCEGRSTAPGASPLWASASFELQLNLELLSSMSTVNATMSDSAVELECEMGAYIRPDSSLIWEGPGGQRITSGTSKHQITFSDGSPMTAVNGSGRLVPSRVSTLVISNPGPSDAGIYTCRVLGVTNAVVTIDLLVDGLSGMETTESTTANSSNNSIFPVIGAVLGSAAIIIVILAGILAVVCGVIYTQNKSRTVCASNRDAGVPQPVYDYIDLPELKDDHDQSVDCPPNQVNRNDGVAVMERNEAYGLSPYYEDYCDLNDSSSAADISRDSGTIIIARNEAYGQVNSNDGDAVMERNEAYGLSPYYRYEDYCDLNDSSSAADISRDSGTIIIARNEAYGANNLSANT